MCSWSEQPGSWQPGGGSHPRVRQWENREVECSVYTALFVCAVMKYPRLGIYKEQELGLDVVTQASKPQHLGGGGERIMDLRLAWAT